MIDGTANHAKKIQFFFSTDKLLLEKLLLVECGILYRITGTSEMEERCSELCLPDGCVVEIEMALLWHRLFNCATQSVIDTQLHLNNGAYAAIRC